MEEPSRLLSLNHNICTMSQQCSQNVFASGIQGLLQLEALHLWCSPLKDRQSLFTRSAVQVLQLAKGIAAGKPASPW